MESPSQVEQQQESRLAAAAEAVAARAVAAASDAAASVASTGGEPEVESRKRPVEHDEADSSKRERLDEPCEGCSPDTVTRPSYILGQPSSSMLDSWLEEDMQPESKGPVVKGIRDGLRVLVPMLVDGDGVLSLCQKLRDTKGASVVALAESEDTVRSLFEKGGLEFTVDALQYEPPWFMNASTLTHLTRPVPMFTAKGSPELTVYVCDLMDPCFVVHGGKLKGSCHRVWDQGKLAHTPPVERGMVMQKILEYSAVPSQLLVCGSVHEPAEVVSSLPGTVYSLPLTAMRALAGSNSAVHRAKQVNRRGEPLSWMRVSAQQGCVYWIWLVTKSDTVAGQMMLRPPACPCCR